jgi:hypothetical protein
MKSEYCECGCHGMSYYIANRELWEYNDLKGTLYLYDGHGNCGKCLGTFPSKGSEIYKFLLGVVTDEIAELEEQLLLERKSVIELEKKISELSCINSCSCVQECCQPAPRDGTSVNKKAKKVKLSKK